MFKPAFSSLWGKCAAAAVVVLGMGVGVILTSDLGRLVLASNPAIGTATVPSYAPPTAPALEFPVSVLQAPEPPSAGPTETVVENVGPVEVSYEVPVVVAPPPPPPPPQCVGDLSATVNGLATSVAGMVSAQQAGGVLEQVNSLGVAANACAQQVAALGSAGTDQIIAVGQQLSGLVGAVQALPLLSAPPAPSAGAAGAEAQSPPFNPVETAVGAVGEGLEITLGVVGAVTGGVSDVLGFVLNPTG